MDKDPRYIVNPALSEAFNRALDRERLKHEARVKGKHTVSQVFWKDPGPEYDDDYGENAG